MRFIVMHRTEPRWEAGESPEPALVARVGALIGDLMRHGVFLGAEGLRATSHGVRLRFRGPACRVTNGPFSGENELPAGFVIVRVASLLEARGVASRLAAVLGDLEIEIRPVTEAWDMGLAPKPDHLTTTRYMLLYKADPDFETGARPGAVQRRALARLLQSLDAEGVLITSEALEPSATAKRFQLEGERYASVDGPFAESKELIAGYMLFKADSMAQAVAWAERYCGAVAAPEVDLRRVTEGAAG